MDKNKSIVINLILNVNFKSRSCLNPWVLGCNFNLRLCVITLALRTHNKIYERSRK